MNNKNVRITIQISIIVLFTALLYAPSFKNNFVWDDQSLILGNHKIQHLSQIPKLFFTDFFDFQTVDGPNSGGYYRPLTMATFALDWLIWQENPFGYHLINLLLHCLNALLGFWLIQRLLGSNRIAFISALCFSLHPLQVDSVAYISGRTDLLAVTLLLSSFFFALSAEKQAKKPLLLWFCSLITYFGALLSKEIGIVLPPLLFLYYWAVEKKKFSTSLLKTVPYLVLTLFYLLIRGQVLNLAPGEQISYLDGIHWRFFCTLIAWIQSMPLFFWPSPIYFERFQPYITHWIPQMGIALTFFAAYLMLLSILFKKNRALFFFASLYGLALLPVMGLHPLFIQDSIFWTEHFFYLPSLGFFPIVVFALSALLKKKRWPHWLTISTSLLLVSTFSFFTVQRVRDWKNEKTLFTKALAFNPNSARAHNNLALFYELRQKYDSAIFHLKEAIQINPNSPGAYNNLGNVYKIENNFIEAEKYYKQAIQLGANTSGIFYNLADLYLRQGNIDQAESVYQKGLQRVKNRHEIYNHLGMLNIYKKEEITALMMFQKALELKSDFTLALNNMGILLAKRKQYQEAEKLFKKALHWNPDQAETHNNLGNLYFLWNKLPQAKRSYQKALDLAPEYADPAKGLKAIQQTNAS